MLIKLKLLFLAFGIKENGNQFDLILACKRWLINHKMLLHREGIKLWQAECYLEIYAFNFDKLEEDFNAYDTP